MTGMVKYGETVKVFYRKTEAVIDGTKFELAYYILKTPVAIDELKADTYGIEIVKSNLDGVEISRTSEIDIWTGLPEAETLTNRLVDRKSSPENLHNIVIEYVDEISCVEYVS